MDKDFKQLLDKFLNNSISENELEGLLEYFKDPTYKEDIERAMLDHWSDLKDIEILKIDEDRIDARLLLDKISEKMDYSMMGSEPKHILKRLPTQYFYKIAAVFLIGASIFFGYQKDIFRFKNSPADEIKNTNEAITLTLDNGEIKIIQENDQGDIKSKQGKLIGSQNGNQLNYGKNKHLEELVYNTLTIPSGKQFELILSDGSLVLLNSGSSIRYPVQFIEGQNRKIFLEGEAYFDVAKDKAHPFIVTVNNMNLEVLGTEFNLSHYPEDQNISTVLVEGSVKLYDATSSATAENKTLTPGDLALWDKTSGKISVAQVDTNLYTAWKDGILNFKNLSFHDIRTKLERHFNVTIENNYPFLENQVFTATFSGETLHEILDAFSEDTPFQFEYKQEMQHVIIHK